MSPTVRVPPDDTPAPRSAVAVPLDDTAVVVSMRHGARGPWSIVTDVPADGREMAGPPPGYVALAGIASCTLMTVAGVASRGGPAVHDLSIAFEVTPRGTGEVRIVQRLAITADVTGADLLRLTRAAGFCPVGKIFTKRALEVEDRVVLTPARAEAIVPSAAPVPPLPFPPGVATASWLPGTREWRDADGRRVLEQEGEVSIRLDCTASGAAGRRWGWLGGHTAAGWAPLPSAYAKASLASSTLMTLRARADELGIDPRTLRVEVRALSPRPAGGKRASQELAASGQVSPVRWLREVTVAAPGAGSAAAVRDAMLLDRVYLHTTRADLIASEEVEVHAPRRLAAVL